MTDAGSSSRLLEGLDGLVAHTDQERADLDRLRALAAGRGAWDRTRSLHLTGSALVVHPATERVLLRWHERQQAWMQVGGHADPGETDPLEVARREGAEETGLDDLVPWPDPAQPELMHAVVVPVPANETEPAHEHGDLRYLLATDRPDDAEPEHEAAALRWLTVDEALALTDEPNVEVLIRRAAERFAATR